MELGESRKVIRCAILFQRIGPYHSARLASAGSLLELHAVECVPDDMTYGWESRYSSKMYRRAAISPSAVRLVSRLAALRDILDQIDPEVVVLPGWSSVYSLCGLDWATAKSVPVVMMSESQALDHRRSYIAERVKAAVVSMADALFVGGSAHREYVECLGINPEAIYDGYDVVDNEHYRYGSEKARLTGHESMGTADLPDRYFLSVFRFIPKKNPFALLKAYSIYRKRTLEPWNLVILGDGRLRNDIAAWNSANGLSGHVWLPGFIQYEQIPKLYGLAQAFILPSLSEQWGLVVNEAMASGLPVLVSERCGCARDLVRDGINGFTFDPCRADDLASAMLRIGESEERRNLMGKKSAEIIALWSLERFAKGLLAACEYAIRRGPRRKSRIGRMWLRALMAFPAVPPQGDQ